jgi:hypothetical protein
VSRVRDFRTTISNRDGGICGPQGEPDHQSRWRCLRGLVAAMSAKVKTRRRRRTTAELPWRDLRVLDKVRLATRAVLTAPCPLAVTLNLAPSVAKQAAESDWFRRRLIRHFEEGLGRPVAVVMSFHWTADAERLHVHAAIAACEGETELVCEAARKAGGRWQQLRGRSHQVHVQTLRDDGWAHYMMKHYRRNQRTHSHIWSMTNVLRSKAKKLHLEERRSELNYRPSLYPPTCRVPGAKK